MNKLFTFVLFAFLSSSPLVARSSSDGTPTCELPQESYIEVDKTRVRYVESGTGPAIVMVHGNAGSVDDFNFNSLGMLCRNHRVIAVDRPGHGKSDRPNGATLQLQTRLLHDALVRLGVTRPILVGHSWGGSLALAYAVEYGNELSGIILLAPAAYSDGGADQFMRTVLKTPLIGDVTIDLGRLLFGKHVLKKELKRAFYPDSVPDEYLRYASSWLHHEQLRSILEDEYSLDKDLDRISKHYADIRLPVVIVTGDQDRVVSAKLNAYRLQKSIAKAQLIELSNTGHQVPQTHPESIYNAVAMISND